MMANFTKLYVDDVRPLPEGDEWTSARSAWEALVKLELIQFEVVSLDHDLASFVGNREITGYDIALWLAERKHNGLYVPPLVIVHSANPVGRQNVQAIIDRYLT